MTKLMQVLEAKRAYDLGTPIMTDAEYDALYDSLSPLEKAKVPVDTISRGSTKVVLPVRMLSLNKTTSGPKLLQWLKNACATRTGSTPQFGIRVSPKLDGMSLLVRTKASGEIVSIFTRGDGRIGEDVTTTAKAAFLGNAINRAHKREVLPGRPERVYRQGLVRGEAVIAKSAFLKYKAAGFTSARNFVVGAVRSGRYCPDLRFIPHDVWAVDDHGNVYTPSPFSRVLSPEILLKEELTMDAFIKRVFKRVLDLVEEHEKGTLHVDGEIYDCDGIVVSIQTTNYRTKLGETAHHPNWAIAYKFAGETGTTKLVNVEWQVSRTGTITPVAIVEPITLSDATITRSTLHTHANFLRLDPSDGAEVSMTRRGSVIPHVEWMKHATFPPRRFAAPTRCPSCQRAVVVSGDYLLCANPSTCTTVQIERLLHWTTVLDWQGWGPETVRALFMTGDISTPADFYSLDERDVARVTGPVIAAKLMAQVRRVLTIDELLRAIGIDHIGEVTAQHVGAALRTIPELVRWARDPVDILHVGVAALNSLEKGLREAIPLLQDLASEIEIKGQLAHSDGIFSGMSVVFTGALTDMSREEAQAIVREQGGSTPPGLTKTTSILVVGDNARDDQRGKRDKAEKYNAKGCKIEIWTEAQWVAAIAKLAP